MLVSLTPGVGDVTKARGKPIKRVQFDHVEEFELKKRNLDIKARDLDVYAARLRRGGRYQEFWGIALFEQQIVLKQQLQQAGTSKSSVLAGKWLFYPQLDILFIDSYFYFSGMFLHRMVYPDSRKMLPHVVQDNCLHLRRIFINLCGVEDDVGKLFLFSLNNSVPSLSFVAVLQKFFGEFLPRLDLAQGMDKRAQDSFFISVELRGHDNCLVLSHNGEGRSHTELLEQYSFRVGSFTSFLLFLLYSFPPCAGPNPCPPVPRGPGSSPREECPPVGGEVPAQAPQLLPGLPGSQ